MNGLALPLVATLVLVACSERRAVELHVLAKGGAVRIECNGSDGFEVESREVRRLDPISTSCRVLDAGLELGTCPCPQEYPHGCLIHVAERKDGRRAVTCNRTEVEPSWR